MASVKVDENVCEFNDKVCAYLCGMCPDCIFAPKPPGSTLRRWKASDEFKKRFLVRLLHRCTSIKDLESIEQMLSVTSWTWFNYSRSGSPAAVPQKPTRGSCRPLSGKPLGVDLAEIWNWFNNSPDWMKSSYLCRVLSLCDLELLRMLSNLTNVLLIRQKHGFMQLYRKVTKY